MAEASIKNNRVTVLLELSEEETAALYTLLMNVGGTMTSPRGYCCSVRVALDKILSSSNSICDKFSEYEDLLDGDIIFRDKDE